jgi:general secretion pathway protein D
MNREISIAVNVDIKAPAGDKQVGNTVSPVFTDRNIQHTIRLKEGDTNVLGGIISTTESTSMSGLPILKDIPALKYFFGREQKTRDDVEVIVMLTPHIVHMPDIGADDMRALSVGTVTTPRLPSITVPGPNATEPANRPAAGPVPGVTPLATPVPFGTPVQPVPVQPTPINPGTGESSTTQSVCGRPDDFFPVRAGRYDIAKGNTGHDSGKRVEYVRRRINAVIRSALNHDQPGFRRRILE